MLQFDKYAQEANHYLKTLAKDLGHPEEEDAASRLLRAVFHTIRERITISESFDLISQLPMFLKAVYVDQWSYQEEPKKYRNAETFIERVEDFQKRYGEDDFKWDQSTEQLIDMTIDSLKVYLSDGQLEHLKGQLPEEMKSFV